MIAQPDEFAQYCCELLYAAGPCTARRMFGGYGISTDGLTLALVADLGQGETLWLKAGPDTRALFEAAGCERFTYQAKGKERHLGFYSAPGEAMESAREMAPWAHLALQAAIAARQPKKARSRKKK
ncbi:TfoX/Sxy family protein [Polaromonas glacialis]|uniref:TfoX/Sxy family protein n=1 Tax=Polaromonas glacialis TaxID=866564 RepID=UPI000496CA57|nr:TfoX/Sxy family protein [Polaromonas glacialis]